MNITFPTFSHWLTLVCAAGGLACIAAIVLYSARHILRYLLDQLCAAGRLTKLVVFLAFAGATLFGGAKHGSETNDPSGGVTGSNSQTNDPPPMMMGCAVPCAPQSTNNANSLCDDCGGQGLTALPSWHTRGAYCDWKRIDFPDTFAFPSGTNLLTGVTLMSYGELRETLRGPVVASFNQLTNQPTNQIALSLEPAVSSVSYGLTPSNSLVFVWENACVNRDATNRVNAAIELFESGEIEIRFGDLVGRVAPRPPQGFIGEGQNLEWSTNTFAFASDAIAEKGYETWLMQDHVGHNEPNGRYKLAVTIAALPEHGPCYLVCGPYRMVVTQPGTYSFPLMDMTEYELYTCPVAVPLTYEFDDGWDPLEPDAPPYMTLSAPRMALGAPRNDNHERVERFPGVFLRPNYLTREQARQELIEIRCNAAGIAARDYTSVSGWAIVRFTNAGDAVIEEACRQDDINIYFRRGEKETCGTIHIRPDGWWPWWQVPEPTNDTSNVSSTNGNNSAGTP